MPTTTSLTTTYAGKHAGETIFAAFTANESLQHITVKPNIEYKQVVRKLVDDVTFAAPTCDFTPTGTITLTERILTLEKFQVHRQMCKKDFLADWTSADAQDGSLNAELQDAVINNLLGQIAEKNETVLWQGINGTTGEYDGLITLMLADSAVIDVATPAAITANNVFSKIQALIDAAPTRVKRATEKPFIYMGQDVWEKFIYANAAAGNGWYTYAGGAVPPTFMGLFDIKVCPGMPTDTMVLAQKSNLWFGTWVLSDWNQISVLDMFDKDLSDNVRFAAKFLAGAQYGFGDEITLYNYVAS
jgi:hypothetical protein